MNKKIFNFIFALIICFFQTSLAFADANYLTILHTNDTHGRLMPIDYSKNQKDVGGIARRAYLFEKIKNTTQNLLILDAGDFGQGTIFYKLYGGVPDIKIMEKIGYEFIALGNHEFDKGIEHLENLLKTSDIEILCANIEFKDNPYLNSRVKKYAIKDYNGFKIGIIGVITNELESITNNLQRIEISNSAKIIKEITEEIDDKTNLIIVLSHCGISGDLAIARKNDAIDVIIGGHTHTKLTTPIIENNVIITQAGEFGLNVGRIDLKEENDKVADFYYSLIPINSAIPENSETAKELEPYQAEVQKYENEIIGQLNNNADARLNQIRTGITDISDLIADAIKSKYNADIVIMNSGSYRIHKIMEKGNVSRADIMTLLPFENKIVIADVNGENILKALEKSVRYLPEPRSSFLQTNGIDYTIDLTKNYKNRISNVKIKGEPIDLKKYYKIALSDYIFYGGDNFCEFKKAKNVQLTDDLLQNLVIEYFEKYSPINVKVEDNINYIKN
ncbi:MAG: bifunctional UDP-sugar hydrolase/5'-nucleotidase [Candidatus Gastranaerophilales bacterium]|nr:bifunctional UDP-sugar hydrolase/5'-nucleotidase [Candidatus Gastranaerophilales bacterium]